MGNLAERARGRWREILPALGIDAKALTNKHSACPVCGGKDRFRFDDKNGSGSWICNQGHGGEHDNAAGAAGNGVSLIMDWKSCSFPEAAKLIETVIGTDRQPVSPQVAAKPQEDEEQAARERYQQMTGYWRSAKAIQKGDPADLYLRSRVGAYKPTRALRFLPETTFAGRTMPALISAYVDVHGELASVQRTLLTMDGRKAPGLEAPRANTGTLPEGGAIRLCHHENTLGIAEGVETALAATAMYGVPCWAAVNAGRLEKWEPPEGVRNIIVFGDADFNYRGQLAAYALAHRLSRKSPGKPELIVQVAIPDDLGADWNDMLLRQKQAA